MKLPFGSGGCVFYLYVNKIKNEPVGATIGRPFLFCAVMLCRGLTLLYIAVCIIFFAKQKLTLKTKFVVFKVFGAYILSCKN